MRLGFVRRYRGEEEIGVTTTQEAGEDVGVAVVKQTQGLIGCYDVYCDVRYDRRCGGDPMRNALCGWVKKELWAGDNKVELCDARNGDVPVGGESLEGCSFVDWRKIGPELAASGMKVLTTFHCTEEKLKERDVPYVPSFASFQLPYHLSSTPFSLGRHRTSSI